MVIYSYLMIFVANQMGILSCGWIFAMLCLRSICNDVCEI